MMDTTKRGWPGGLFVSGGNSFHDLIDRRPILLPVSFVVICILFLVLNGWTYIGNPSYDLRSFYAAAKVVFNHGQSPYDLALLGKALGPNVPFNPFLYPPSSTLLFLPLAKMGYAEACGLVLVINNLLYLSLMWIVPVSLLGFRPGKRPVAFLACVIFMSVFNPTRWVINLGEVDILALESIVLFWILSRSNKEILAGLFLALAILVKTYPAVLIPFLFLSGKRREVVHTFVWLGISVAVSYLALPHFIWHDWLTNIVPAGGYLKTPAGLFAPSALWNQGLNGFFARIFTHGGEMSGAPTVYLLERAVVYFAAALVLGATALAVWRNRRLKDSLDRCMIVTLPAIFLIAPFSYLQHLVYLIPPILFLVFSRSSLMKNRRIVFYSLLAIAAIVIAAPKALPLEFYAVFILWGLATYSMMSGKFEFVGGKTDKLRTRGEKTWGLSLVQS